MKKESFDDWNNILEEDDRKQLSHKGFNKKIFGFFVGLVFAIGIAVITYFIISPQTPEYYQISVESTAENVTNIGGEGIYKKGDKVTINVDEIGGFRFMGWTLNGKIISQNPSYTFSVNSSNYGKYIANFKKIYKININSTQNGEFGVIENSKGSVEGDEIGLSIIPNKHYKLEQIYYIKSSSGTRVDLNTNSNMFIMTDDNINVYTKFSLIDYVVSFPEKVEVLKNGTAIQSGQTANYGDKLQISCTPTKGYYINEFTFNGSPITSGEVKDVESNIKIVYKEKITTYKIDFPSNDGISILNRNNEKLKSFVAEYGSELEFKVVLNEGYTKSNITIAINGESVTPENGYFKIDSVEENKVIQVSGVEINKYTLSKVGENVTVVRKGQKLIDGQELLYNDKLTILYSITSGHLKKVFTVNDNSNFASGSILTVKDDVNIVYLEVEGVNLNIIEGEQNHKYFVEKYRTYSEVLPQDYTEYSTCGFYTENTYENLIDLTTLLISDSTLYTQKATLNVLKFSSDGSVSGVNASGDVVIPLKQKIDGQDVLITKIADNAFSGQELSSIILTGKITSVGASAFANTSVSSISFPKSVTTIGDSVLSGSKIQNVTIQDGVTVVPASAFYGSSIRSITLPDSITEIGASAFQRTTSLTSINFPKNLKIIGSLAFASSGLSGKYVLPDGLTTVMDQAFAWSGVSDVEMPQSCVNMGWGVFFCSKINRARLSDALPEIPSGTFTLCYGLTDFKFPASIRKIDRGVFMRCTSLVSIEIPEGCEEIGEHAFASESYVLGDVKISSTVKKIGNEAFMDNKINHLKVTFAENSQLEEIGDKAFYNCNEMDPITLPSSLKKIGDNVFYDTGLSEIVIPESVTYIGANALKTNGKFYSEIQLKSVSILGEGVWKIYSTDNLETAFKTISSETISNQTLLAEAFATTYVDYVWKREV